MVKMQLAHRNSKIHIYIYKLHIYLREEVLKNLNIAVLYHIYI